MRQVVEGTMRLAIASRALRTRRVHLGLRVHRLVLRPIERDCNVQLVVRTAWRGGVRAPYLLRKHYKLAATGFCTVGEVPPAFVAYSC